MKMAQGRWMMALALTGVLLPGASRAQFLAPLPGLTVPNCANTAADQSLYQRQHNQLLPLCSTLRPGVTKVPAPAALTPFAPIFVAPTTAPTTAPAATTPGTTTTPGLIAGRSAAPPPPAGTNAAGAPVNNVPTCVTSVVEQNRYETATGVRPPLCMTDSVAGTPLAPTTGVTTPAGVNAAGMPVNPVTPAAGIASAAGAPPPPAAAPTSGGGAPSPGAAPSGAPSPGGGGAGAPPDAGAAPAANNIAPQSAPVVAPAAPPRPSREPDQLVVYWPDSATVDPLLARIQREFGLRPAQQTPLGRLGGVVLLFRTTGAAGAPPLDTLRARMREALPQVAIDFNMLYYTDAGPRQYFGAHLMLPAGDGPAVPVGIVDTEVGQIAALKGVQIVRKSFLADGDVPAADGHGTAVASLIAGRDPAHQFAGVAPAAPLHAAAIMRRIGEGEGTSTLLLAQALDWLLGQQVRVINLSLGGPGDALMARLIDKLTHQPGVIVVAAAGNGGPDAPPSYPAAYPGVLAVTATNAADQIYGRANRGSYVSLAAPGEDLWVPDQAEGHYVSGTSFAAALVSGLAGRVLAREPRLSADSLLKHLCNSAKDLGAQGPDPVYGCGLLQAAGALDAKNFADFSKKN
ncbi:MAG: peptidase and in, kexin, sedolisin [Betaproteobacteria bacterium]|nr:peptidase and in, kexin, sedolisin [Betaproteobacteria bacterium]